MSDKSPWKVSEASYKQLTFIELLFPGQTVTVETIDRNFESILKIAPSLTKVLGRLVCFTFFDKVFAKIDANGTPIQTESEPFNLSGKTFLPNRGKIYYVADVKGLEDEKSKYLAEKMHLSGADGVFVASSGLLIPFDPKRGDRVMQESELTSIDPNLLKPEPVKIIVLPEGEENSLELTVPGYEEEGDETEDESGDDNEEVETEEASSETTSEDQNTETKENSSASEDKKEEDEEKNLAEGKAEYKSPFNKGKKKGIVN